MIASNLPAGTVKQSGTRRWMEKGAIFCATVLLLSLLAVPPVVSKDSAPQAAPVQSAARSSLDGFFCMNGITPFHHYVSTDPKEKEALWETLDKRLKRAKEIGVRSMRVDLWWGVVEPEKGRFAWELPDRVIDEIVKAGLEPFPIFCYASAWSGDVSPDTDAERELFGRYVHETVKRYKDRVRVWEVWNEPNITPFWSPRPDAELYFELLKVAYTQAKAADPTCVIVGLCTAGPDYPFIEKVYQQGGSAYLDALSFHHYDDRRDEAVLEEEIREIRRIMQRWGDGHKPLLITELGLLTGVDPIGMKPMSHEDQASWIMKKHLVSIASGVSSLYYFCMADWKLGKKSEGQWGLMLADMTPKRSETVYRAMTARLGKAEFLGRAYRLEADSKRHGDAEVLFFQNADELLAIAWVRKEGENCLIHLPADGPITIETLDGHAIETLTPDKRGVITVRLSHVPRYIRALPLRAKPIGAITFQPEPIYLAPGETRIVTMTIENPAKDPLTVRLESLLAPPAERKMTLTSPQREVTCPPGKTIAVPITITLAENAPPFKSQVFTCSDPTRYSYGLTVYYAVPFHIQMLLHADEGKYKLTTCFQNRTESIQAGDVRWKIRTMEVKGIRPFTDLKPGATASITRNVAASLNEADFNAEVRAESGAKATGKLCVWGQPLLQTAPTVDGVLEDWAEIPQVRLTPKVHQLRPDPKLNPLDDKEWNGWVAVAWTQTHLFVAADVTDPTPLVNPHSGKEVWRGDAVELYLGFGGQTPQRTYGDRHFHLGIAPAADGRNPKVWNWNPRVRAGEKPPEGGHRVENAAVAFVRTAKGYCLEAAIPLAEFDERPENGQIIGFDVSINNKNSPEAEANEAVMTWNGTDQNWRDPANWGAAVILEKP